MTSWTVQRFDPFLGWVTFATYKTRQAAIQRCQRAARALSAATLRVQEV